MRIGINPGAVLQAALSNVGKDSGALSFIDTRPDSDFFQGAETAETKLVVGIHFADVEAG